MKYLVVILLVVLGVIWFLMTVGHAVAIRECREHGHIWEWFETKRKSVLMCMRCGRRP